VNFFARLCPHEGADLSNTCRNDKAKCPWHGRMFNPILSVESGSLISNYKIENDKLKLRAAQDLVTLEAKGWR
ncbi:MAG: Rieske 2Fe-2S domain-containing protein, partial [Chlamydiae bacterium]|nr:Rieske 2Fe-2S domain-containing protein [Chlamydiota bacterium]